MLAIALWSHHAARGSGIGFACGRREKGRGDLDEEGDSPRQAGTIADRAILDALAPTASISGAAPVGGRIAIEDVEDDLVYAPPLALARNAQLSGQVDALIAALDDEALAAVFDSAQAGSVHTS